RRPASRPQRDPAALAGKAGHRRSPVDDGARSTRRRQQAEIVEAGMERTEIGDEGAADEALGADLAPQLGARQHRELVAEMPPTQLQLAGERLILRRRS